MSINDLITLLPRQISFLIFDELSFSDLSKALRASKRWNQLIDCEEFWKWKAIVRKIPFDNRCNNFKSLLKTSFECCTLETLKQKIVSVFEKTPKDLTCIVTCFSKKDKNAYAKFYRIPQHAKKMDLSGICNFDERRSDNVVYNQVIGEMHADLLDPNREFTCTIKSLVERDHFMLRTTLMKFTEVFSVFEIVSE